jgi:mRNA-degrading endonuclease RelE of RelBE toxin-antitoxin system
VISEITDSFRQDYGKLSLEIKAHIKRAYKFWLKNPHHPSLRFKKIHATEPIWSVRVGLDYRVVGVKHDNKMLWFFVGSHKEYEALIKSYK